jgi:hypothetical protein
VALDPEEAEESEEAERQSTSALMGGGLVAGSAAGDAVDAAVTGPVGVLLGGAIGAVAGAIGVGAAGELANKESTTRADDAPTDAEDTHRGIPPR